MSLGVANPAGALALGAVAILIALHLLGRRRGVVRVATLFLWRQIPPVPLERHRRLRPDLLFLLQLGLVLALIGGLVRPYLEGTTEPVPDAPLVLVLDVSASMQARETDGSRFELARRRARRLVESARGETMLVTAAERPHTVLGWTADRDRTLARLEAIEPLDVAGDLAAAVALAAAEAEARPGARVAVLTDLPPTASGLGPADLGGVDFVQIGRTDDNVALAGLAVAEPPLGGGAPTATILVRSHTHRDRRVVLEARVAGTLWARRELVLGPRATAALELSDPPRRGVLEVMLAAGDALAADDRALGWLAPATPLDLVLVSDAEATVRAFTTVVAAVPNARLEVVPTARAAAAALGPPHVAILAGWTPPALPPGASALLVVPPAGGAVCPSTGAIQDAAVVDWEDEHPLLAGMGPLQALAIGRASRLDTPLWATPVVLAATRQAVFPLLVAGERDGRRIACLGTDLGSALASDDGLPLLLLTLGTLRWLAEPRAEAPLVVETGVPTVADAAIAAAPEGDGLRLAGDPPVVVAEHVGIHHLGSRLVLASLLDDRESDIGRDGGGEWPAVTPAERRLAPGGGRGLDRWFYLAAAALLGLEWLAWTTRVPR